MCARLELSFRHSKRVGPWKEASLSPCLNKLTTGASCLLSCVGGWLFKPAAIHVLAKGLLMSGC